MTDEEARALAYRRAAQLREDLRARRAAALRGSEAARAALVEWWRAVRGEGGWDPQEKGGRGSDALGN